MNGFSWAQDISLCHFKFSCAQDLIDFSVTEVGDNKKCQYQQ
jgi:hypothetical protein